MRFSHTLELRVEGASGPERFARDVMDALVKTGVVSEGDTLIASQAGKLDGPLTLRAKAGEVVSMNWEPSEDDD